MSRSVASAAAVRQSEPVDQIQAAGSTTVDPLLEMLRQAISDSNWTLDALAVETHTDKGYLWRMLNGEKPLGAKFLVALPDEVESIFARLYAESFGLIVVAPTRGEDAVKQLVAGLVGVLAPRLPVRAGAPIKAGARGQSVHQGDR